MSVVNGRLVVGTMCHCDDAWLQVWSWPAGEFPSLEEAKEAARLAGSEAP